MVLFISWGVGGSEIFKMITSFINFRFPIKLISCSEYALNTLPNSEYVPEEEIFDYIDKINPDIVISERSNGLDFHKLLTCYCVSNLITNIVITDFYMPEYCNYPSLFEELPDFVTSVSEEASKELKNVGFKEEQILNIGNPSYNKLYKLKYKPSYTTKPRVLYASQGGKTNIQHQENIDLFSKFYNLLEEYFENFTVDIKLHPMELDFKDEWLNSLTNYKNTNVMEHIPGDIFVENNIISYDLVLVKCSTIQLQSQLIGIPTIFECDDKRLKLEKYKNKTLHLEKSNYIEYTYSNRLEQLLNSMYFKIKFKPINLFNNIEILEE